MSRTRSEGGAAVVRVVAIAGFGAAAGYLEHFRNERGPVECMERRLFFPPRQRRPVARGPVKKKPLECVLPVYSNSENAIPSNERINRPPCGEFMSESNGSQ